MRGLDPRIHAANPQVWRFTMDCRVKPGNDKKRRTIHSYSPLKANNIGVVILPVKTGEGGHAQHGGGGACGGAGCDDEIASAIATLRIGARLGLFARPRSRSHV
jgi:hypothetical protein